MKRVLILGGTGDAVDLATRVPNLQDIEVITSLAGQTGQPAMTQGMMRVGGFGGTSGLGRFSGVSLGLEALKTVRDRLTVNGVVLL
jgi:precorrin-6A/cobalt-precorrin-6A reductase